MTYVFVFLDLSILTQSYVRLIRAFFILVYVSIVNTIDYPYFSKCINWIKVYEQMRSKEMRKLLREGYYKISYPKYIWYWSTVTFICSFELSLIIRFPYLCITRYKSLRCYHFIDRSFWIGTHGIEIVLHHHTIEIFTVNCVEILGILHIEIIRSIILFRSLLYFKVL